MDELTQAQADVLYLLSRGQSHKQIAYAWHVDKTTVWRHANAARDALGAKTIYQAVVIYALSARIREQDMVLILRKQPTQKELTP